MKIPSPCIDVCKYKLNNHCIGCSMTKSQKRIYKKLKNLEKKKKYIKLILKQQKDLGKFKHWEKIYQKKMSKEKYKF